MVMSAKQESVANSAAGALGMSGRAGSTSGGGVTDAAGVTRDQWQHFLDFYRPIEDKTLADAMQTDFTAEGDKAGATAAAGVNASRGSLARHLSRSGVALSAEERTAVGRRSDLALAKGVGRAENTTRRGLSDSRTQLLQQIVGIGRGVSNTATSGMQSVADMAAQRKAQHTAQRASTQAANTSGAMGLASLAIAFI